VEGVDDWYKSASLVTAHPRRSTSSLDPMDGLPAFWTLPFGVIAGLFVVGRIARWLQVLLTLWKGDATKSTSSAHRPEIVPILLTSVAHPTPWLALVGGIWAIHRLIIYAVTPEWRWFIVGFLGGPSIMIPFVVWRLRQLRHRFARKVEPPAS
jgi:hypothetical protein